ncbi:MAG: GNAT family N-acetyltransferase [Caulobacteraceae bacterium]
MSSRFGLEIRVANGGDAPGIIELMATCGAPVLAAPSLAERLETLRHKPGATLLALEWGPPSGLIGLHWYDSFDASTPTAQITTLLVSPDARRRGIGRALLKVAAQSARQAGCGALLLMSPPQEPSLEAFCRATGFVAAASGFIRPLRKKS